MGKRFINYSLMLLLSISGVISAANIESARVWRSPEKTRIVFDVDESVTHSMFMLENPMRVVIDVDNSHLGQSLSELSLLNTPIKKIRTSQRNKHQTRIVLDLDKPVKSKSFLLAPNSSYGNRLVVDLFDQNKQKTLPAGTSQVAMNKPKYRPIGRDIVIVVDAGHGGEDPGAIGHKIHEKDVTLAIANQIAQLINKEKGFTAKMTRNGDYYLSLRERLKFARQVHADLFVSVHADAFVHPKAKGMSIYTLSKRGASSEAAKWLADTENNSDLIGGEEGISLGDKDGILASVLLDLSITDTQARSSRAGKILLGELGRNYRLHKKQIEHASFVVLKSPDIPSLLIETGFITNPDDAKILNNRNHQKKVALTIYSGIRKFFYKLPPEGSAVAQIKNGVTLQARASSSRHKVRYGDTLSQIAERYEVPLVGLRYLNSITNDMIEVGQLLRIP